MTAAIERALTVALLIVTIPLHAFGWYALALVVLGYAKPRRKDGSDRATSTLSAENVPPATPRIAVLVVAHDEESVIADSVATLARQHYPAAAFHVYVIADRCSDRTAERAREAGARVLERSDGAGGKSAAVAFGVDALAADAYDAVAIFDADNLADPDFLEKTAARLSSGERVVQGFVDSKNPGASWVAGSSALGFWAIAELAQEPRERLGLSTPLMGTGFAVQTGLARRLLTTGGGLTDDLDLAARRARTRRERREERAARTVDEKPTRLGTAVSQRHRWMQGRWAVAGRHVPVLLRTAFDSSERLGARLRAFDVAVQLLCPSLLFTAVATALVAGCAALVARSSRPPEYRLALFSLYAATAYYLVPAVFIARHRPGLRVWLCYLLQPAYLVLSLPLAVSGFLTRREKHWVRTPKGA